MSDQMLSPSREMEARVASSCPPMTLRQREVLEATQVHFLVPPLPSIFLATATQILTKDVKSYQESLIIANLLPSY